MENVDGKKYNPMTASSLEEYFYNPNFTINEERYNRFLHNGWTDTTKEAIQNSVEVFDKDWIDASFVAPFSSLEPQYQKVALTQTAFFKMKSCRLGGNIAVNMPPGSNILADPMADGGLRLLGLRTKKGMTEGMSYGPCLKTTGMGRWYSENIDDHTQTVIMQFGVPAYNSVMNFLANSISYRDTFIAKKGRVPEWYDAGKVAGTALGFIAFPISGPLVWSIKMGVTLLWGDAPYSYYYLNPTMGQYWSTVNDIANYFAVKLGIMKPTLKDKEKQVIENSAKRLTTAKAFKLDPAIRKLMVAFFSGNSNKSQWINEKFDFIDIYELVARRQYMYNQIRRKVHNDMIDPKNESNGNKTIDKGPDGTFLGSKSLEDENEKDRKTIYDYIYSIFATFDKAEEGYIDSEVQGLDVMFDDEPLAVYKTHIDKADKAQLKKEKEAKKKLSELEAESKKQIKAENGVASDSDEVSGADKFASVNKATGEVADAKASGVETSWTQSIWDYCTFSVGTTYERLTQSILSSLKGSTSAAIFAVNPTGTTSDSLSNSTGSIATGDAIKSLTRAADSMKASIGNGETGVDVLDSLIEKLTNLGMGIIDGATLGLSNVINGIINGGYVDIPDKWEDSSFSGNSTSYTMDLVTPYGNEISRFQDLFVPLAMILAGAMPRGIGKAGYTSPYICKCFSKSTQQTVLGIITDVSVSTGITNQPFVNGMKTNSLRVTFTVKELSNLMVARINTTSLTEYRPVMEEDTPIARWINRLAGMDYEDLTFAIPRLNNSIEMLGRSFANIVSATRVGHNIGNILFDGNSISAFFKNPAWTGVLTRNI